MNCFLFDLDGTILNTIEDLADALNFVLALHGLPLRSLTEVRSFVGNGIRRLIELGAGESTPKATVDVMFAEFSRYYKVHCKDKTKPYDGITDVISELRKNGALTAVVSNKADFAVKELVDEYFPGMFDIAVGERENIKRKPAPDTVNEVLTQLNVSRDRAVYIGDSEVDILTAKNAGLPCVSVTWGFRDRDVLESCGASVFADDPGELASILLNKA